MRTLHERRRAGRWVVLRGLETVANGSAAVDGLGGEADGGEAHGAEGVRAEEGLRVPWTRWEAYTSCAYWGGMGVARWEGESELAYSAEELAGVAAVVEGLPVGG